MALYQEWGQLKDVDIPLERFEKAKKEDIIRAFAYIGEEIVNKAKESGTYDNITGNLRSSLWYAVWSDGKRVTFDTFDATDDAKTQISEQVDDLDKSEVIKNGVTLIVGAGMEYGVWVEKKGYDVLTEFVFSSAKFESELKELLG